MNYCRFKMPSMNIFCVLLSTTILLLGCHDHQALDNFATNKKLKESIATDLNNKAEELLDSNPDSSLTLLDSALKFNSDDYILYFNIGHVYIGKKEYLKTIDIYKQMLIGSWILLKE